jgi:hypothetical protein
MRELRGALASAGLSGGGFRPTAALQETVSHLILLGVLVANDLGFTGGLLLLVIDLLLAIGFSMAVHRDPRWVRSLFGLLGTLLMLTVFLGFCLVGYAVAMTDRSFEQVVSAPGDLYRFDAAALRWAVLLAGAHLLVIYLYSKTRPDPKRTWDLQTSFNGGLTFLTLMLLIFVVAFLGGPTIALATAVAPTLSAESVLVGLLVGLRWFLAQGLLLLPEEMWLFKMPDAPAR